MSKTETRNSARHNLDLPSHELFDSVAEHLSKNGRFNVVIPFKNETEYIERAFDNDLYIQEITHTLSPNGSKKRSLISFGFNDVEPNQSEILIKNSFGEYSSEYIELTKDFYLKKF